VFSQRHWSWHHGAAASPRTCNHLVLSVFFFFNDTRQPSMLGSYGSGFGPRVHWILFPANRQCRTAIGQLLCYKRSSYVAAKYWYDRMGLKQSKKHTYFLTEFWDGYPLPVRAYQVVLDDQATEGSLWRQKLGGLFLSAELDVSHCIRNRNLMTTDALYAFSTGMMCSS